MKPALTKKQKTYRKLYLLRYTMTEIGNKFGVKKQTVHESLQAAAAKGYEIKPKRLK